MDIFYTLPALTRAGISVFIALCVLIQTVNIILKFYRRRQSRAQIIKYVLEIAILFQILVCSALFGQVVQAGQIGLIPIIGYRTIRYTLFIIISVLVLLEIIIYIMHKGKFIRVGFDKIEEKDSHPIADNFSVAKNIDNIDYCFAFIALIASFITLPFTEDLSGSSFAYFYISALVLWFVRSLSTALIGYRVIKLSLSVLSVKNALDSLNTGVVFFEKDGFIILNNIKMQDLMIAITGDIQRNGRHFYEALAVGTVKPNCEITQVEDRIVCILPDKTAWKFNIHELSPGKSKYFQLIATDVSEFRRLNETLTHENEELLRKQKELSETISDLHTLTHQIETQKAKMRAHDVIGERLALLLSYIRGEQNTGFEQLRVFSKDIISDLRNITVKPSPRDEFDSIKMAYGSVGVDVIPDGEIPQDTKTGQIIVDIIREAVANAVRHGFATQINVKIDDLDNSVRLEVTDNGRPLDSAISEGGGITEIRKKARETGGFVVVTTVPQFTLTVELCKSSE